MKVGHFLGYSGCQSGEVVCAGTFMWLWLTYIRVTGTLGRPITMKHDGRTDECIESIASTDHLSDQWIAPLIHLQSFLATVDEVYASIQASGGRALVEVTTGSLHRQFNSVRAYVEKCISSCPSSTGASWTFKMADRD